MLLKIRRKQLNWKKKETMLSWKGDMKLPKIFILKPLKRILIWDKSGQIVPSVEIPWKNMRMLWRTVYPLFHWTPKTLRKVFKVWTSNWSFVTYLFFHWVWKPNQDNHSERKRTFGLGSIWWSQRVLRIIAWARRKFCCRQELGEASWCPGKRYLTIISYCIVLGNRNKITT